MPQQPTTRGRASLASDWPVGSGGGSGPATFFADGSPAPSAPSILPQRMQLRRPEDEPIPSAQIFETLDFVTTAVVQANVALPTCAVQLPAGFVGRLSGIAFYITNLLATTDVRWTVRQNGNALAGFSDVRIFPGVAARVTEAFDVYLLVPDNSLLEVVFRNNDGGTYQVGASLSGWFWSQQAGRQWLTQGVRV